MNKKGFTLIELLAVIVILAIIALIATPLVLGVIKSSAKGAMQTDARVLLRAIDEKKVLNPDFDPTVYNGDLDGLLDALDVNSENYNSVSFGYNGKILLITIEGKGKYEGLSACGSYNDIEVTEGECEIDLLAPVLTLNGNSTIETDLGYSFTDPGATALDNKDGNIDVQVTGTVNTSAEGDYTLTYTATDAAGNASTLTRTVSVKAFNYAGSGYVARKGVNGPVLATGMIPVKWNGSSWITTETSDPNWYNYDITSKKWANAINYNKATAIDYSGNQYVGTIYGGTQQSNDLTFDGVDDYIMSDTRLQNYNFNSSISIVARFKAINLSGTNSKAIIGNWESSGGGMAVTNTNNISFNLFIGGAYKTVTSVTAIQLNRYYTIVGTYDGTAMKIYIDGTLDASLNVNGSITPCSLSFAVGTNPNPGPYTDYINATFSHAAIYKTALSAADISTNFASSVNLIPTNLLFGYNLKSYDSIEVGTPISTNNMSAMWVWIPRYGYQIATNYNTNTTGTINVKFLQGTTNTATDSSSVVTSPTYSGSGQTNYILHPAFDFGGTQVTGIWIAKFEASSIEGNTNGYVADASCVSGDNVTNKTIKIIPNAMSWRCLSVGNAFTVSRNMETKSTYGWGTIGSGIDTHLIKNIEWGVAVYLSKSTYGKNNIEVWPNTANYYITGCSGDSATATSYTGGCQYAYNTVTGGEASTTGNIYGIYDMSGGTWEYVSAYVDNANAALNNGSSITGTLLKYRDVYSKGTTDSRVDNYNALSSKKGDAMFETSASAATASGTAWFGDYANMPYVASPWFIRGSRFTAGASAGLYIFYDAGGGESANIGFRPVLLVQSGL